MTIEGLRQKPEGVLDTRSITLDGKSEECKERAKDRLLARSLSKKRVEKWHKDYIRCGNES